MKWVIIKLLGFVSKSEREMILTELVKKHFNTIGKDDILKIEKDKWMFEGEILSDDEIRLIVAESKQILKMNTWEILRKEILWRANHEMFIKSTDTLSLTMGKSWQYVLDVMQSVLIKITKS